MVDDPGPRPTDLTPSQSVPTVSTQTAAGRSVVPADEVMRRAGHVRTTYTMFGIILALGALAVALWRPSVADPSVVGLVWAGLVAMFVLGFVFPRVSLRGIRASVTAAPTDLVVGQLSSVMVDFAGRGSGLMARCGRSPMFLVDITSPDQVKLPLEVAQRGAYDHLPVEVSTDAPFSVVMSSTTRIVPLPRQLLVGPLVVATPAELGAIGGDRADLPSQGRAVSGDTVRSVRPYVQGDPAHMVHWPSSARLGSLVVRELEPPQLLGVAVMVQLVGEAGDEALELAVSRAAGVAVDALARGGRVMLCTATATGPVAEEVSSELQVRRRLAMATSGPLPAPPDGWPVQIVTQTGGSEVGGRV